MCIPLFLLSPPSHGSPSLPVPIPFHYPLGPLPQEPATMPCVWVWQIAPPTTTTPPPPPIPHLSVPNSNTIRPSAPLSTPSFLPSFITDAFFGCRLPSNRFIQTCSCMLVLLSDDDACGRVYTVVPGPGGIQCTCKEKLMKEHRNNNHNMSPRRSLRYIHIFPPSPANS